MLKKRTPNRIDFISITEACQLWGIPSKNAIHYAHDRGHIFMRKSAGIWLVYVRDMYRWFGKPKQQIVVHSD